jgi:cobalt-zinc-cadmium resistance protein CzcA
MIERVLRFSLENRFLVIVLALLGAVWGAATLRDLPIDAVPDVTPVQVQVLTRAPALGPVEVEQFVTYPVELAMSGLPDVREVRSVSRYGLSAVTIYFAEHVDLFFARQLVNERLAQARELIPEGFGTPEMGPASTGLGEVFMFTLEGAGHSSMALRSILDWEIAYRLRSVPGVVEVNTWGGFAKQYQVVVDPARLIAYGLSLKDVFDAVSQTNAMAGGGYIEKGDELLLIRGEGLISSLEDVAGTVILARDGGTPIRVGDVARVEEGHVPRIGSASRDGEGETVIGMAQMLAGENARIVARRVKARLGEIQSALPPGVRIVPYYDRTALVERVLTTASTNLIEGGLLVIAVLLLLLGSLRGGLLVALAIPLSMLFAFIGMHRAGISGNLMSLGAIDFGLIVDGSVVMVENILRRLGGRERAGDVKGRVLGAALEVARPVVFGVGIIVIVYLPILTLEGTEGRMFRPMALTVVFALSASLLLALTLMPAAATVLFRGRVAEAEPWIMRRARALYAPVLDWALRRPGLVTLVAAAAFAASGVPAPFLGGEFIPRLDEGDITIQAWRLPSISMSGSVRTALAVERVLKRFPEVDQVVSRNGSPEVATDIMGIELSDIFVMLRPRSSWTSAGSKEELIERMAAALEQEVPGVGIGFTQPIEMRFNELIAGVRSDIAVRIYGEDLERLRSLGDAVARALEEVPGAADVRAEQVAGLPVLRARVDRDRLARHGLRAEEVLEAVEVIRVGHRAGTVLEGVRRFDLMVRLRGGEQLDLEAVRRLPIATRDGQLIPLGQLADVAIETGPAQVSREGGQRRITVECNVRGRDIEGFVREARARVARAVDLPPGYYTVWGGAFEDLERARRRLLVVVPLALFLIFVLLYAALHSVRLAALVFTGVPFAAAGGVWVLWLRGLPFSISAGVGFIALFGVAVLNGLVMLTQIRRLQAGGMDAAGAAREGALLRLRPVLMTALVAGLGFVPMALSTSPGAEVQRPLASVVIGGLVTSTLLTLVVVPALFGVVGRRTPAGAGESDQL